MKGQTDNGRPAGQSTGKHVASDAHFWCRQKRTIGYNMKYSMHIAQDHAHCWSTALVIS